MASIQNGPYEREINRQQDKMWHGKIHRKQLFAKLKDKSCPYCQVEMTIIHDGSVSTQPTFATYEHRYPVVDMRRAVDPSVFLACYKCNHDKGQADLQAIIEEYRQAYEALPGTSVDLIALTKQLNMEREFNLHLLAEDLRTLRIISRKLTIRQAAEVSGVDFTSLGRIEREQGSPSTATLAKVCNWMGKNPGEYFTEMKFTHA